MAWLIVKDLKQKNFKNVKNKKQIIIINQGYLLNIGDVIRIGNMKLKVNNIKLNGYEEKESCIFNKANSINEGNFTFDKIEIYFRIFEKG